LAADFFLSDSFCETRIRSTTDAKGKDGLKFSRDDYDINLQKAWDSRESLPKRLA
jgi:hypothetical protein